jgi:DNA-binding CsgD family transcriptional regulator
MSYVSSIEEVVLERIAVKLFKKSMTLEEIFDITGLSIMQLRDLRSEQK